MSFRGVLRNGENFLNQYSRNEKWWNFASRLTLAATGYGSKWVLNSLCNPTVEGRNELIEILKMCHLEKRGLITVMNHTSVLDEPLVWGMLPGHILGNGVNTLRWTLGADNICFKNKLLGTYFSLGQVLSTKRFGSGPFQGSLDAAVKLLSPSPEYEATNRSPGSLANEGAAQWVHIFPEGFVNQPIKKDHSYTMRYFRWGVSRLVLEATVEPVVLPLWTTGLDLVMPEDSTGFLGIRNRLGRNVLIKVGEPVSSEMIRGFRQQWVALTAGHDMSGEMPEVLKTGDRASQLRSEVAKCVRDSVLSIRDSLAIYPPEDPRFADPDFWKTNTEVFVRGKSTAQKVSEGKC
jgi:monolysocardiolipin acyltransferase